MASGLVVPGSATAAGDAPLTLSLQVRGLSDGAPRSPRRGVVRVISRRGPVQDHYRIVTLVS